MRNLEFWWVWWRRRLGHGRRAAAHPLLPVTDGSGNWGYINRTGGFIYGPVDYAQGFGGISP